MSARRFRVDKKYFDKKSRFPEEIIKSKQTKIVQKAPDSNVPEEYSNGPPVEIEAPPQRNNDIIDKKIGSAIPRQRDETPIRLEEDHDTEIEDSREKVLKNGYHKYLTFQMLGQEYGLEILKVKEIIGMIDVTSVPMTPDFVRGVINLRGKVIPVVDLRLKFGMEAKEDTEMTCIIVVQLGRNAQEMTIGIIVDQVSEVLNISQNQIEPPPSFGASIKTDFILGMGKVDQKVVTMLDIDRVLGDKGIETIDREV